MWQAIILTLLTAAEVPVEAQPLVGEATTGLLSALDDRRLTLQTAKGRVSLELDTLAALAVSRPAGPPGKSSVWVELVDGSSLVAGTFGVAEGTATLVLAGDKPLAIPVQRIRSVRFEPQSEALAAEWTRIAGQQTGGDLLVVHKGDALDYHKGVVGAVTPTNVEFKVDPQTLKVNRAKVHGLVYYRAAAELPRARFTITEASGSVWLARTLGFAAGELTWTTPAGVEAARPLGEVAHVDFSKENLVYLSDLRPESVQWTPLFGSGRELASRIEWNAPRFDRGIDGGSLQVGGRSYRKGLSIHSRTLIVYRLPGRFTRLLATAGIDDRVRTLGKVRLTIRGDEQILFDADVIGTEPPAALDLKLDGVRRLSILVDFGKDLDVGDYLDLCEARLLK